MFFIINREEKIVGVLNKENERNSNNIYFEDILSSDLASGSETLVFSTIADRNLTAQIVVGNYIAFKKNDSFKLLQIMETSENKEEVLIKEVYCESAGLELINTIFEGTHFPNTNIKRLLDTVLQDTDWKRGYVSEELVRSLALDVETEEVYSILQKNIKLFGGEIDFRVEIENNVIKNRYIDIYAKRGNTKPRRLELKKDIKKISRKMDLKNFATKLIGVGKKDISFKDIQTPFKPRGQNFVINEKAYEIYNKKGKHITRKFTFDTEDAYELLKQTEKALKEMSEPKITYEIECDILNFDEIELGDTILLSDLSFSPPLMISTRVIKLESSTTDKSFCKVELSNCKEIRSDIVTTVGEGDILDNAIGGQHLKPESIDEKHIKADVIETKHLKADIIKAEHIQAGTIIAGSSIIADGAIGSAQINEINAGKISSGTIDTSNVNIIGANGHLKLKNNRLQVFEGVGSNAFERISLGDVNSDGSQYGLRVRGKDGQTILLDENGVYSEGITDGAITNEKISDNTKIDGKKLDITTVINEINEDGSVKINGARIEVEGSTLDAELFQIKEKQDENFELSKMNSATIKANQENISLKVDEQIYILDKQTITSNMEKNTSNIDILSGKIDMKVEKTFIDNLTKEINTKFSDIQMDADQITTMVSGLDGKYTQLKQTVDGFNFSGYVTFSALGVEGATEINGANIITNTIKAESISGGTLNAMDKIIFSDNSFVVKCADGLGSNDGMKFSTALMAIDSPKIITNGYFTTRNFDCKTIDCNDELHVGKDKFYNQYSKQYVSNLTVRGGNVSVAYDIWADNFKSRVGTVVSTGVNNAGVDVFEVLNGFDVIKASDGFRLKKSHICNENPCLVEDAFDGEDYIDIMSLLSIVTCAIKELKEENNLMKEKIGVI